MLKRLLAEEWPTGLSEQPQYWRRLLMFARSAIRVGGRKNWEKVRFLLVYWLADAEDSNAYGMLAEEAREETRREVQECNAALHHAARRLSLAAERIGELAQHVGGDNRGQILGLGQALRFRSEVLKAIALELVAIGTRNPKRRLRCGVGTLVGSTASAAQNERKALEEDMRELGFTFPEIESLQKNDWKEHGRDRGNRARKRMVARR